MSRQQILAGTPGDKSPKFKRTGLGSFSAGKVEAFCTFSVQNFRNFLCSACFVLVGDQLRINPIFTAEVGKQSVHG